MRKKTPQFFLFLSQGINLEATSGSPLFTADHPFMYYVLDRETNTTIFSGCIKNIPADNQL